VASLWLSNNPTGHFTAAAQSRILHSANSALAFNCDEVFLDFAHNRRPEKSFAAQQRRSLHAQRSFKTLRIAKMNSRGLRQRPAD